MWFTKPDSVEIKNWPAGIKFLHKCISARVTQNEYYK